MSKVKLYTEKRDSVYSARIGRCCDCGHFVSSPIPGYDGLCRGGDYERDVRDCLTIPKWCPLPAPPEKEAEDNE